MYLHKRELEVDRLRADRVRRRRRRRGVRRLWRSDLRGGVNKRGGGNSVRARRTGGRLCLGRIGGELVLGVRLDKVCLRHNEAEDHLVASQEGNSQRLRRVAGAGHPARVVELERDNIAVLRREGRNEGDRGGGDITGNIVQCDILHLGRRQRRSDAVRSEVGIQVVLRNVKEVVLKDRDVHQRRVVIIAIRVRAIRLARRHQHRRRESALKSRAVLIRNAEVLVARARAGYVEVANKRASGDRARECHVRGVRERERRGLIRLELGRTSRVPRADKGDCNCCHFILTTGLFFPEIAFLIWF